ncbi:MAG: hypothetical protein HC900_03390 [Methylacidiphilales bacterium]|nr:hypothetical protein [Candidatus Methylacidiphilales bacterium]
MTMKNCADVLASTLFDHNTIAHAFDAWTKAFEADPVETFGSDDAVWEAFAREFLREVNADITEVLGGATGGAHVAAA